MGPFPFADSHGEEMMSRSGNRVIARAFQEM